HLALELRERDLRLRARAERRRREHERGADARRDGGEPHERLDATAMLALKSARFPPSLIGPRMCAPTSRPRRSMKNVSGVPVTPYRSARLPPGSRTTRYVTPCFRTNARPSEIESQ